MHRAWIGAIVFFAIACVGEHESPRDVRGRSLARNLDGRFALTGGFAGTATFDDAEKRTDGRRDLFVSRLNEDGEFQWTTRIGTAESDVGLRVAIRGNSTYVLGELGADTRWGGVRHWRGDRFLARLRLDGSIAWKTRLGRHALDPEGEVGDVDVDVRSDGTAVVAGAFTGTVDLGDGERLTGPGRSPRGLFVARYTTGWSPGRRRGPQGHLT